MTFGNRDSFGTTASYSTENNKINPCEKSKIAVFIPARYGSSRFPGKPLAWISNEERLIQRVYRRCSEAGFDTYVVTDSEVIANQVPQSLIVKSAKNGTQRCFFAANKIKHENVINVQGDMIDIDQETLEHFAKKFSRMGCGVFTAFTDFQNEEEKDSKDTVKVVHNGYRAFYFTRENIPGDTSKHVGLYGFRNIKDIDYESPRDTFLEDPMGKPFEDYEDLEQMKWIEKGAKIEVVYVDYQGKEINTPEDLKNWSKEASRLNYLDDSNSENQKREEPSEDLERTRAKRHYFGSGPIGKPESKTNPESGFSRGYNDSAKSYKTLSEKHNSDKNDQDTLPEDDPPEVEREPDQRRLTLDEILRSNKEAKKRYL